MSFQQALLFIKPLVLILAVLYVALAGAVYYFQSSLMYFPSNTDPTRQGRTPFEPWISETNDLYGYVRDDSANVKRAVILFHGNGGEAIHRSWLHDLIPDRQAALVLAEYPGYGSKNGKPTQKAIVESGRELLKMVRQRWPVPITLVGESLGTGVASALSGEQGVERIALISPFTSARSVAETTFFFLPLKLIMRDQFDSLGHLAETRLPMHIIHGTADEVIPFAQGKSLFDAYLGDEKYFTAIPNAGHNNLIPHILAARQAEDFRKFIRGL